MTRYVMIPGAGGTAWFWHRVVPLLDAAGHETLVVDLPGADPHAGLRVYTDLVLDLVGGRPATTLVAQSLGGFTAAMVAARTQLAGIVFVNAMIPLPGETPGEWGKAVGSNEARTEAARRGGYSETFDERTYFLHDVPPAVAEAGAPFQRPEADVVFADRCDFTQWPAIPIRAIAGADDRLFPVDFQRRVVRERLGIEIEVVPGGHLAALSYPSELVTALLS